MPAAERTLTQRDLNRAVLARQLLLERAPTNVPRALERIGGLQAQYAPSMYIGLWSRLERFERDDLVAGIWTYEKRGVRLEPFGRLDPSTRRQLQEEAERLASLHE